jgi:hypothetical protein
MTFPIASLPNPLSSKTTGTVVWLPVKVKVAVAKSPELPASLMIA